MPFTTEWTSIQHDFDVSYALQWNTYHSVGRVSLFDQPVHILGCHVATFFFFFFAPLTTYKVPFCITSWCATLPFSISVWCAKACTLYVLLRHTRSVLSVLEIQLLYIFTLLSIRWDALLVQKPVTCLKWKMQAYFKKSKSCKFFRMCWTWYLSWCAGPHPHPNSYKSLCQ